MEHGEFSLDCAVRPGRLQGKKAWVWRCSCVGRILTQHVQIPGFHLCYHIDRVWRATGRSVQSLLIYSELETCPGYIRQPQNKTKANEVAIG